MKLGMVCLYEIESELKKLVSVRQLNQQSKE